MFTPFARTIALPCGQRVRVRLARPGDRPAVQALLADRGYGVGDDELRGLLSHDLSDRLVLAAYALSGGVDRLVGIGAVDLADGAVPDTLVVDRRHPGVAEVLGEILLARAEAHLRRAA